MTRWSDYTTGERIKALRGKDVRQVDLAEATGLSIVTIQAAEQDKRLSLPTLLAISDALHCDPGVILGMQAPSKTMDSQDRAALRELSRTIHDTHADLLPDVAEAPSIRELQEAVDRCWRLYWTGDYTQVGVLAAPLLVSAAARLREQPVGEQAPAWVALSDAYRISAYVSNLMGARDLAYAAIGHAKDAAERAADDMRQALVTSGRAWIYLRDARLDDALRLAEKAAVDIEPRFSKATAAELTAYGSHINFSAVVASRMKNRDRVADYLSQSHAVGARMGQEHRAYGTLFGPMTATTQAVGINTSLGQVGKALALIDSIHDVSTLTDAAQHRYAMDKAMAQADARMWEASLTTLETELVRAPQWAKHQALPGVILAKVAPGSTEQLRRVAALVGGIGGGSSGFAAATAKTAL